MNCIDINEARRSYDALAKQFLSYKEVLATILQYTVREFKGCTLDEIISCFEGTPEIGTVAVDDKFMPKIDAAGSEAVSTNDGIRSFDIKFKIRLPHSDNEEAALIINLESQHNANPGYTLEKRGIYYLSRMISSQYNVEFKNSDFDKLKKVYSIWICTHASSEEANTITEYRFKPENLVGKMPDDPKKYDLMSLVMIKLGSKSKDYEGLVRILDILLNMYAEDGKANEALEILEKDYNLSLRKYHKEVDDMCNLSQGIYNDGWAKGMAQGMAKGRAEGIAKGIAQGKIDVVKNLLNMGFPLDKALAAANIDKETYEKHKDDN